MSGYTDLLPLLRELPSLVVALSGGLDSRFLTHAALEAGCSVRALTAVGAHMPREEAEAAAAWATRRGVEHLFIPVDVLAEPEVAANSRERCYACKLLIFSRLKDAAGGFALADGTNADDTQSYRPGLRALRELGIRSPLAETGLSKAEIRRLALETGLDRPEQAARPCLLTRLEYGLRPSEEILARLAEAEFALAAAGAGEFRLRLRAGAPPLLQLAATPKPALRRALSAVLRERGFENAEMLADVPVSGYFDARGKGGV